MYNIYKVFITIIELMFVYATYYYKLIYKITDKNKVSHTIVLLTSVIKTLLYDIRIYLINFIVQSIYHINPHIDWDERSLNCLSIDHQLFNVIYHSISLPAK